MRKFIKWKYLNSVTSLCKKIVVYNTCFRLPVIANQRAGFSGNPPVREEMYRQLPCGVGNVTIYG